MLDQALGALWTREIGENAYVVLDGYEACC